MVAQMAEEWRPVKGYEGLYEASNFGRIKSLKRHTTSGGIMKIYVNPYNGYCYVNLCKDNKSATKRVHKIIYTAFNGWAWGDKYDKAHTIDHIDGDKTNNRLSNLEVCTQSENQLRAFKNGLNPVVTRPVIDLTTGEVFQSATDATASIGGRNCNSVIRVCQGKRSHYRNHEYAYYEDYINGTVPAFKGRNKRKSSVSLWVD